MTKLSAKTRKALTKVATSTLTGILNRRGFKNMFMEEVWPIRQGQPRLVGLTYTMRFIPAREDNVRNPAAGPIQQQAMEGCPPGHVLVVDSRGDARAASAGDIYCGRLAARGCVGIVTDGDLRDSDGVAKTGLVAYLRRPSSPPSGIVTSRSISACRSLRRRRRLSRRRDRRRRRRCRRDPARHRRCCCRGGDGDDAL
jgi:regulator of RNase E activity RraA